MIEKLRSLAEDYLALQQKMQDPEVLSDPKKIATIGKKLSDLEPLIGMLKEYDKCQEAIKSVDDVKDDPELKELAEEEAEVARQHEETPQADPPESY